MQKREHTLIERFGSHVHAFDPTPKSIQWIKAQTLPAPFHFHDVGLAAYDGVATFHLPQPTHVSYSITNTVGEAGATVQAKVQRLDTIARELGHRRIDILKMDIEGAENAVIEDLANTKLEIGQVLVEFHHTIGRAKELAETNKAIATLNHLGFRLFFNSTVGREFSFIREGGDRR